MRAISTLYNKPDEIIVEVKDLDSKESRWIILKTVLSVDVAKNKSMIMLMNSDGEILIDTKEIKHNLEEFEKVKEKIKEINPQNLTVFMESTGTYHLPVERYFKENGLIL